MHWSSAGVVIATLRGQPAAPAEDGFRAIVRSTFPHDMLNVHFDCAFRKTQFGGDQLVGQAELQFRQNLLSHEA